MRSLPPSAIGLFHAECGRSKLLCGGEILQRRADRISLHAAALIQLLVEPSQQPARVEFKAGRQALQFFFLHHQPS
jgi:hypothetical protein